MNAKPLTGMGNGAIADAMPPFSLLGGPLHRLGRRLGLVHGHTNTLRLGCFLGASLWAVAATLALVRGHDLLAFPLLGAHVRLLVAIPLLFAAETLLDPRLDAFMRFVVRARIVPGESTDALLAKLAQVRRWTDGWAPDVACLLLALAMYWSVPRMGIAGADTTLTAGGVEARLGEGLWYSLVCLTVLRFLLLRWAWRLVLWVHCLWTLSRLPLRLLPAHADGTSGLGGLETVHLHFAPLVFAISAVLSASFAVDIARGAMALDDVYPAAAAILLLDAILFVAPLLLFLPPLRASKLKASGDYLLLAERYAADFERKWLRGDGGRADLLGAPDIQSLADLTTAVTVVRGSRVVPVGRKLLTGLGLAALLPLAPLVLFKIPLAQLAAQLIGRLTGT